MVAVTRSPEGTDEMIITKERLLIGVIMLLNTLVMGRDETRPLIGNIRLSIVTVVFVD